MNFLINLNEGTQFLIQLIIVLMCLFYGAKKGGIALGLLGGIGLLILVFGFNVEPGKPAISVMLTILAVVVASATLQASGGLDCMLQIAEKILRKNPKYVSILAPFVTSILTMLCGTGHVCYTVLPIIYDVAIKNGIRPERPMAASSIGAQMGVIASPVSVAVVTLTAYLLTSKVHLANFDGYLDLLKITIPSTLCGVLAIGIFSWFRGKDLDKDPEFQEKIKNPEFKKYVYGDDNNVTLIGIKLDSKKWLAMWIFLVIIALVAVLGYFKNLRPSFPNTVDAKIVQIVQNGKVVEKFNLKNGSLNANLSSGYKEIISNGKTKPELNYSNITITKINADSSKETIYLSQDQTNVKVGDKIYENAKIVVLNKITKSKTLKMTETIQLFMLLAGALILIFTNTNANSISKNEIFRSGMIALVAVFGISWMAETMFGVHIPMIKKVLGSVVNDYPWTYAVMLLLISKFVNSQAAALTAFVPLALQIGVQPGIIVAFAPACYGYYILPTYPSDLAAIQFDRSGTTKIGKYVINHSFILPGLIGVFTSCVVGYILAGIFGYLS